MTSKILVTGGAGYIGSHTSYACLDEGFEVVILDDLSTGVAHAISPEARFIEGDVADRELLARIFKEEKPDAVLHFAGRIVVPESVENPIKYYQENTCTSLGLLHEMVKADIGTILFSSTAAVYDPDNGGDALPEDALKVPLSPYGQSKLMTEAMIRDIGVAHGLGAGILRYFNVAGADPKGRVGQSTPNATHLLKIASQVATGKREFMEVYGEDYETRDGTCVRDYIHVSDLASAHVETLKHVLSVGGQITMNCGYGRGATVKEVIAAAERVTGSPIDARPADRRAGDAPSLVADVSRIRETLPSWQPKHETLEEMAETAIAWEEKLKTLNSA
ncbi:UDP-glucose 4-epimerase GalE [Parvularcula sp. ZS-1/3]|uniref:UDP-glucose 4-epimerase n=1 Tax=Parvularcula mediterranea TaxID=2732508 RepID=A0A7Y3RQE3_9PROT|nr:UDP-glucose 4-epimerase GalE [Parvularcula mediterranea]NNU17457.1 UDP-glucose 4-epimerase GalE [Parvularcula mediterranea]